MTDPTPQHSSERAHKHDFNSGPTIWQIQHQNIVVKGQTNMILTLALPYDRPNTTA